MNPHKFLPLLLLSFVILSFFYPFSLFGKLPIPADTIVGLYHPFRDLYAKEYPRGIPFKNSLITDPVRQQYPWKFFAILMERYYTLPLWNPYNLAGSPLIANFQSAVFYPLNILLLLPDFNKWWAIFILLQPLLGAIFMYLYLRGINLNHYSCFLGGFTYAFCGFSIAWLEWGTIGHVALWLPLILLSIDKIFHKSLLWSLIYIFSITSAFFAGHLQTFFYLFLVSTAYFFARWIQFGYRKKALFLFLILNSCFIILTSVQWLPTLQFILLSARGIDQINFQKEGWFLPVRHLIQFIAPDFFGNPTTLNYWGVWNYGEFIAYIGILPLIMACFALFYRYDKKTIFFGSIFFISLILALPTWFAKLPFELQIPFINTAPPTRLLFLTDFALSILVALGFDYFIRTRQKGKIIYPLIFILFVFLALWIFVLIPLLQLSQLNAQNINIAKKNLLFPSLIFGMILLTILLSLYIKSIKIKTLFLLILISLTIVDLFRFAYKFTPFTDKGYLYPETNVTYLSRKLSGYNRIMTTDARILPPNFTIMYYTQSIDGYDPLYLKRYGELIAAMEREAPDVHPPFGFNRILNPHNYNSIIADLLGVKYILSLTDLYSPKLQKIFTEGETRIYENKKAYPRTFFVNNIYASINKQQTINAIFDKNIDLKQTAIVEDWDNQKKVFPNKDNKSEIIDYRSNEIKIKTSNKEVGFLVLTDSFYPAWHAKICSATSMNCRETKIYLTDYNFRGIIVPSGVHTVIFYITLL